MTPADLSDDEVEEEDVDDIGQRLARQIGWKPIRRINMLLLEGLFFYEKDDPYYFDLLRQRQGLFRALWKRCFGLDLEVTENVAYRRLLTTGDDPDAGFHNQNIRVAGRALFTWTDQGMRERSLIFLLFLLFYEEDVRHRKDAGHGERRFFYHEFYRRVQQAYDEWFDDREQDRPSDATLFFASKEVFDALERYRFVENESVDDISATDSKEDLGRGYALDKVVMYRALEGLRAYNPRTLTRSLVEEAYGMGSPDSLAGSGANGGSVP